jgi:hypothetical protein
MESDGASAKKQRYPDTSNNSTSYATVESLPFLPFIWKVLSSNISPETGYSDLLTLHTNVKRARQVRSQPILFTS